MERKFGSTMVIITKEIGLIKSSKVQASLNGLMVRSTSANSGKTNDTA